MNWQFSRKHLMILSWWHPESAVKDHFGILLDGSVRSGKTLPGSVSFVLWAFHQFPQRQEFFIAGKTIHTVVRNVVRPLINVAHTVGLTVNYKRSENLVEITNSANVTHNFTLFGGHDESSQDLIRGFTAAGGFFDEAPIMPKSFVETAVTRLSVEGATSWFTSNPMNPAHWFKKEYIDLARQKGLIYLHLTMDDNMSLSERVRAMYRSFFTGVFYRRNILGEWCAAEGLVYPGFVGDDSLVFDFVDWRHYTEMFVSVDYGIQNAMVYLLFGWNIKTLRWEVIKEWRHSGKETDTQYTDAEYYQFLLDFAGDKPVRDVIVDPSATSFIAVIRKAKRFRGLLAKNEVVAGIGYVASLFHIGKLAISRDCVKLIEAMGGYVWDEKKAQRTGEEVPLKVDDHEPDALRYGCFTHIRRYEKRYGIMLSQEATQ